MLKSIARLTLYSAITLAGCVLPPGSNPNYTANSNSAPPCPKDIAFLDCGYYNNGYNTGLQDSQRGTRNTNDRSPRSYLRGYDDGYHSRQASHANNNQQYGYEANQTNQSKSDTVFSPGQGVVCDRKANFCADDQGIAFGYTKEYLGEQAESQLMEQVHGVGVNNWDGSSYSLSNGVSCDSKARRCTGGRDAATYSRILFGN